MAHSKFSYYLIRMGQPIGKETAHHLAAFKVWLKVIPWSLKHPFLGPDVEGFIITGQESFPAVEFVPIIYCVVQ